MSTANKIFSRDEILRMIKYMIVTVKTDEFKQAIEIVAKREAAPPSEDALMDEYEKVQARFLARYLSEEENASGATTSCEADASSMAIGEQAMEQIRNAAQRYPDDEIEETITQLCVLIEGHVVDIVSKSPHLSHILKEKEDEMQKAKGATMNGMPSFNQETMNMLQFAMSTLTPEQRTTMQRVQGAVMSGKSVSAEDQHAMMEIQQHIAAFVQTMSQFNKQTPATV